MTGAELMTAGGFLLLVVGSAFTAFWRIWGLVGQAGDKGEKAQADLQSYKLHVAEHYATKDGVTQQMVALTKAVNDVGDRLDKRLDGVTDRLDRVIEASHKPIRRQQG